MGKGDGPRLQDELLRYIDADAAGPTRLREAPGRTPTPSTDRRRPDQIGMFRDDDAAHEGRDPSAKSSRGQDRRATEQTSSPPFPSPAPPRRRRPRRAGAGCRPAADGPQLARSPTESVAAEPPAPFAVEQPRRVGPPADPAADRQLGGELSASPVIPAVRPGRHPLRLGPVPGRIARDDPARPASGPGRGSRSGMPANWTMRFGHREGIHTPAEQKSHPERGQRRGSHGARPRTRSRTLRASGSTRMR